MTAMATLAPPAPPRARPARHAAFSVTVTTRWDEVVEALEIVHDGFVESGYMTP